MRLALYQALCSVGHLLEIHPPPSPSGPLPTTYTCSLSHTLSLCKKKIERKKIPLQSRNDELNIPCFCEDFPNYSQLWDYFFYILNTYSPVSSTI